MPAATTCPNCNAVLVPARPRCISCGMEVAKMADYRMPAQYLTPDQKDIPPQVQALIQNLEAQVKQVSQQLQQAMHALQDKGEDRAIAKTKVENDFQAKILAIIQKSEADMAKHVGSKIESLADSLNEFMSSTTATPEKAAGEASASQPAAHKPA